MTYIVLISIFVNGILLGYIFSRKGYAEDDAIMQVKNKVSRVTDSVQKVINPDPEGSVGTFDFEEEEPEEDKWTRKLLSKSGLIKKSDSNE